jgi:hypothetical protein
VFAPIARGQGITVLIIDHTTKEEADTRYSRGGGGKLQYVDVSYRANIVTPFNRRRSGSFKLTCTKDRLGWIGRGTVFVARVAVDTEQGAMRLAIKRGGTDPGLTSEAERRLSPLQRTTLAIVEAATAPMPTGDVHARLAGDDGTPYLASVSRVLRELADKGLVASATDGPGKPTCWTRCSADSQEDGQEGHT